MVDMVVKRHDIPDTLARVLKILTKKPAFRRCQRKHRHACDRRKRLTANITGGRAMIPRGQTAVSEAAQEIDKLMGVAPQAVDLSLDRTPACLPFSAIRKRSCRRSFMWRNTGSGLSPLPRASGSGRL